mgnify:CR=1 FL=1
MENQEELIKKLELASPKKCPKLLKKLIKIKLQRREK